MMYFWIFRYIDGKWWVRNLRGFDSGEDASAYAKNLWRNGAAIDLWYNKGKWYVWRIL
jgi:hypothetical protein